MENQLNDSKSNDERGSNDGRSGNSSKSSSSNKSTGSKSSTSKSSSSNKSDNTSNRGFASMDEAKQREIASKGGKAAHEQGVAHEWNSEEAREAGRKGGQASHGGQGANAKRDEKKGNEPR